jgi:hypothetical protein
METVMQRLQKALRKEFSYKGILLEDAGDGFVGGWIISKSFEGLNGMQRQKRVWNLFDKYLDEKDRTRLAVFLTFTPSRKRRYLMRILMNSRTPRRRNHFSPERKQLALGAKAAVSRKNVVRFC